MKRTDWFVHDRFGMFIHWGLYAIPARGEWVRSHEKITVEDYQKYFDTFNPTNYEPKKWAKLAKKVGMKYAVMTAKHHDGFCLFDSKLTEYKSTNTPAKRDLIREYVDAFRAEGIKVGFYYSIIDWHHPDYPAYGDRIHPMRDNEAFKDIKINFDNYLEYMHGQVRELLTNYGKIDVMWFDFAYDSPDRDDEFKCMRGETWKSDELIKMIRELQPEIIIDDRLGGSASDPETNLAYGDFASPEQIVPPTGMVNDKGESIIWEACITLNDNWGYGSNDRNFKDSKTVIRSLIECVSKNGNMLLNVGPNAKGEIGADEIKILEEVGEWMAQNSESIYGAGVSEFPKPEWGRFTQKDKTLYAHIFDRGIGPISLNNLNGKVDENARRLWDDSETILSRPWMTAAFPNDVFIELPSNKLPDEASAVIKISLA